MRSPVAEVLQVNKTDISRFSAWMSAAAMLLALAACSDKKTPVDEGGGEKPTPLTVETIIFEPKVGVPGDTLLFTAVITSSSQNEGDYPVYEWTADGGSFVEAPPNKQTVRWVSPASSGVFTITAKAKNSVSSSSNKASVFVGTGENLLSQSAGQIDLIGTGPDFHYLSTDDVSRGVDVGAYNFTTRTASDAAAPVVRNGTNVAYSSDGAFASYTADTSFAGTVTVRPRNLYLSDLNSHTTIRFTKDGSAPTNTERNVYNYPSFSPNGQLIAYQRWAQSWDGAAPDSFHVYIYDRVQQKRTKVTYEHPFPRGFFPTFSTDSKWLVYVLDKNRNGQWDLFASPMTGNNVDGSLASMVRMTDTGGAIVSGAPKELKRPPMTWNPVSPILAIAASDNVLYLVQTTATGSNVIPVTDVVHATEIIWSPEGSQLAATYSATEGDETHVKVVTVSSAGVVTERATALVGDNLRDLAFSPDGKWLLYRVTRGGGSWFNLVDTGAGKISSPVPVTRTDPVAASGDYRNVMSLRPAWTSANLMLYPAFGTSTNGTPGIWTRDLSGLVN
jgi:hypothetical protein